MADESSAITKKHQNAILKAAAMNGCSGIALIKPSVLFEILHITPVPTNDLVLHVVVIVNALLSVGYYWASRDLPANVSVLRLGLLGKVALIVVTILDVILGIVSRQMLILTVAGDLPVAILFFKILQDLKNKQQQPQTMGDKKELEAVTKKHQKMFRSAALFNIVAGTAGLKQSLWALLHVTPIPAEDLTLHTFVLLILTGGLGFYWASQDLPANANVIWLGIFLKAAVVSITILDIVLGVVSWQIMTTMSGDLIYSILFFRALQDVDMLKKPKAE